MQYIFRYIFYEHNVIFNVCYKKNDILRYIILFYCIRSIQCRFMLLYVRNDLEVNENLNSK